MLQDSVVIVPDPSHAMSYAAFWGWLLRVLASDIGRLMIGEASAAYRGKQTGGMDSTDSTARASLTWHPAVR